ncbi:MAG: DNA helicase RecQ [Bacteroidia bacterium]|nr:DNA helicase RecQ [Bacteroidia bacterium]MBP7259955.1 DNA helicase RecQ [Bacteroidia bacterium]MBP9179417.1 DNA helicase RecQ [Bacteroidia bacterium]MBP9723696.1 DNA helicase RecQ [Bacteroidia bacterium]
MAVTVKHDLKSALKKYFGFETFKGIQEDIIKNVLNGKDSFVIMPTGAGKSLCFQLPALMMDGTAIVISPLIALMKNQVDQIRAFGSNETAAHFLNSSLTKAEIMKVKEDILANKTKLLYVAPETLKKDETVDFLKQIKISFVAVDEAHCISEWGHDFRPEYRRIKQIVKDIKDVPMMALTATATPKVQADIQKNLQMLDAEVFKTSFNRPNLYYEVRQKGKKDKVLKEIVAYIKQRDKKSGIIYCLSRKKVEEIAEVLNLNGVKALPYHAGLDAKTRASHQDKFLMEDVDVIVATIAFGMGIDKPDVRFVIHYDVPKSLEGYYQETGRAGRDGLEGDCLLFYNPADIEKLEKFMKDKPVSEREIGEQLIFETQSYVESSGCRRRILLHYFGEEFDQKNCGKKCDNCRHPKEQQEVTKDMIQALQVIQLLKGKFNLKHTVDVITGTKSQAVMDYEHHNLECFGLGKAKDPLFWKSVIRTALLAGFVTKDIESYGLLKMNEKGDVYLKKPTPVFIALDTKFEKVSEDDDNAEIENFYDEVLFAQLKELRKKVAKQKGLPPYIIFQDPSLEDMASKYPITMSELSQVFGVTASKAQKFGKPFLELIEAYVKENDIERSEDLVIKSAVNKSGKKVAIIQNIDRKINLEDISRSQGISRDELVAEIEGMVYSGTKLNLKYYINTILDEDVQQDIFDYFKSSESDSLDLAIKEFDNEISKEDLQLMRIQFISELAN